LKLFPVSWYGSGRKKVKDGNVMKEAAVSFLFSGSHLVASAVHPRIGKNLDG
jgi:hypothetical protein